MEKVCLRDQVFFVLLLKNHLFCTIQYTVKMHQKCINFTHHRFRTEITANNSDHPHILFMLKFRDASIGYSLSTHLKYTFSYYVYVYACVYISNYIYIYMYMYAYMHCICKMICILSIGGYKDKENSEGGRQRQREHERQLCYLIEKNT